MNLKVNFSTALGATFAWYDFIIFNIAVALIFPKLFFPEMGYLIPILVFAVGFLARPIGSVLFGFFGDKVGRKTTLVLTLYVTGISTVMIGLLPTYADIGIVATVLLIVARILQSAAVGGEWAAASTMLIEHNVTSKRKNFITSFVSSGFGIANIMAAFVFLIVTSVGTEFFIDFGWRIPFLLSGILLIIGVYIRKKVLETPEFLSNQQHNTIVSHPLKETITKHYKHVIAAALVISLAPAWAYGIMVLGVGYMVQQDLMSRAEITQIQFFSWFAISLSLIFFGWLTDKIDYFKLLFFAALCSLILVWPIFFFIASGDAVIAMLALTLLIGPSMAVAPAFFCSLFPSTIRQTGSGVSYSLGLLISGIVPVVATQILITTGNILSVAIVYLVLTVISLAATFYLKKVI